MGAACPANIVSVSRHSCPASLQPPVGKQMEDYLSSLQPDLHQSSFTVVIHMLFVRIKQVNEAFVIEAVC